MEPYLYIDHNHTSQFELDELLNFSDVWCQKINDLSRKKESLLARLLLDKLCKKMGLRSKTGLLLGSYQNSRMWI